MGVRSPRGCQVSKLTGCGWVRNRNFQVETPWRRSLDHGPMRMGYLYYPSYRLDLLSSSICIQRRMDHKGSHLAFHDEGMFCTCFSHLLSVLIYMEITGMVKQNTNKIPHIQNQKDKGIVHNGISACKTFFDECWQNSARM